MVGPNGTGKSTLLKLMAGLEKPNNGDAMLAKDATVGILLQEPPLTEDKTVLENVEEAVADIKALQARMDELGVAMGEPDADFDALMAEMGEVQTELDHRNAWDIDSQLEQAMDALRCPPPDAPVDMLSGGERRRVALCKLLLAQPDLLLLDEPTNHLDAESVHWLEGHLKAYPGAVLAVTHDRYFLDNVAEWILELDRGPHAPVRGELLDLSGHQEGTAAGRGPQGRQAGQDLGARAGVGPLQPEGAAGQEPGPAGPVRGAGHRGRAEPQAGLRGDQHPARPAAGQHGAGGPRPGQGVRGPAALRRSELHPAAGRHRRCRRPERRRQVDPVPDDHRRGDPRLGVAELGETVKVSYVDQGRSGLDPNKNVWELVSDGLDHIKVASFEMPSRAYVASFGFKGPDQQKPAGVLSGGERNRLNLALTLKMGGNLLLLDEPTNDLDVETLQSLEDALLDFPGCAVVISHDRWFLDRIATHILAWEGDDETRPSGSGSRATSPTTRPTRSAGSAPRRPVRTGPPTAG